ncbi:MAG: MFS transporter [Paracoccus sp. (in: a-proteobacteria)]|uniref:MFS transporter n=1 Tax=unclassified Paracoccus (in: a-proteobacteria) TaxID=2688777 RepID=UPI000C53FEB3|nr:MULTISPECIES: MFS transporter [unclassified Paracoccus (in: a-proteobacteria)]MBA48782.1 MFS transporter [Paracoccus sp. (in: a-proteobacteria)]MCS5601229.1 MFS transporter [Paracoccus sp. (in: a-proteobacteria)]|tara:strand:+ start:34 stop:1185 length:1152 start_codon:yes stop_codon:yes gene_type:complete
MRLRLSPPRAAVSVLFFANGLMIGSWAPKLPALMARLGIGEALAGLVVLCLGLGSLLVMPVFGAMVARRGSAAAVGLAGWLAAPTLILITLAPNLALVALAVGLFGGTLGGMDVAMNANAVAVERARRRAIMSSCHGFWSLGGVLGAGIGGVVLARLGEAAHAVLATLVFIAVLVFAQRRLLRDAPAEGTRKTPLRLPRSPLPYVIGIMALFSMVPEGAILDWAAVYLQREMGASLALAGWGFAACAAAMAAMRFAGDAIRQRLGAVSTLRISALAAIAGLGMAGLAPNSGLAILGFFVAGLGIANLVPIMFSAAGNLPGLAPGVGLSVVTITGYSGILLAPGSIGYLAEKMSFSAIYLGLGGLLLLPLLLSPLARAADFDER